MASSIKVTETTSTTSNTLSRRSVFTQCLSSAILGSILLLELAPNTANAADLETNSERRQLQREKARSNLLNAIQESKSESEIMKLIQELMPFNPEQEYYASSLSSSSSLLNGLDGEWKLVWSANDDFSPLLRLPYPFKPESYQYFGSSAAIEVGEGRVAQGLTGGILGKSSQLWLSSGIDIMDDSKGRIEIEPPFRLELGSRPNTTVSFSSDGNTDPSINSRINNTKKKKKKLLLVEAGNDATFRKLNARNKEAQLAPKNIYQQLYLERNGPGSLRISSIVEGDPVIVGAILIHVKL